METKPTLMHTYLHTYMVAMRYRHQQYCHIYTFSVMELACFIRDLYGIGGEIITILESDGSEAENYELETLRDFYISKRGYHSINDIFHK